MLPRDVISEHFRDPNARTLALDIWDVSCAMVSSPPQTPAVLAHKLLIGIPANPLWPQTAATLMPFIVAVTEYAMRTTDDTSNPCGSLAISTALTAVVALSDAVQPKADVSMFVRRIGQAGA